MTPLFTIITVCYNSQDTIQKTIESVLSQNCEDYEYLIIDGNSNDSTLDIVKKYEQLFNGKLKWISEPDNGIYDAMNKGIKLAKGEWLFFLNSGDSFYDDFILENIFLQMDSKASIILGDVVHISGSHQKLRSNAKLFSDKYFFLKDTICHQSVFINRTIFEDYGIYDLNYKIAADFNQLLDIFINKPSLFKYVNIPIAWYDTNGVSSVNYWKTVRERLHIIYSRLSKFSLILALFYIVKHNLKVRTVMFLKYILPGKLYKKIVDLKHLIRNKQ